MIRTKIIATLGPACDEAQALLSMFEAGVDICRLNFSHGTLEQHKARLDRVREATKRFGQPIAVLGDLGEAQRFDLSNARCDGMTVYTVSFKIIEGAGKIAVFFSAVMSKVDFKPIEDSPT